MPEAEVRAPDAESLRAQMEVLQTRIGIHGSRLWQLPLTYLGVLVVSLSQLGDPALLFPTPFVFAALSVFGLVLLWCLFGAFEGYRRAVRHMARVEAELGLVATSSNKASHYAPYFGLVILGIAFTVGAALYFAAG